MLSFIKILTLYILSVLVMRGLIPQEIADSITTNPEVLLFVELGLATLVTLLLTIIHRFLRDLPNFAHAMMVALVLRVSRGKVQMKEEPEPKDNATDSSEPKAQEQSDGK